METKRSDAVVGVLFVLIAGWFAFEFYRTGMVVTDPIDRLPTIGRLLGVVVGIGAAYYFLFVKHRQAIGLESVRGLIAAQLASDRVALEAGFKLAIEPQLRAMETHAKAQQKHADLVMEDDFRRRQRRDEALLAFSKTVNATTRAFRSLGRFRMTSVAQREQLVNALAPALSARQFYLDARDALDDLHVVDRHHEEIIRSYSHLLIDMIIDVRRTDQSDLSDYDKTMNGYLTRLDAINADIGELLGFFLAPQQRPQKQLAAAGASDAVCAPAAANR